MGFDSLKYLNGDGGWRLGQGGGGGGGGGGLEGGV